MGENQTARLAKIKSEVFPLESEMNVMKRASDGGHWGLPVDGRDRRSKGYRHCEP